MYVVTILQWIHTSIHRVYRIYFIVNHVFHIVERMTIEQLILRILGLVSMHFRSNDFTINLQANF